MMLLTGQVWVSPGQWGNVAFFAFLMACLGGLVVNRAARSDVTYAFIVFYMALVFGRSIWLGEPMAIPLHRLENGALLLFTFFMISDPQDHAELARRTDPVRAARRVWRVVRAVPAVPDERAAVVAGALFDDGSADRLAPAREGATSGHGPGSEVWSGSAKQTLGAPAYRKLRLVRRLPASADQLISGSERSS